MKEREQEMTKEELNREGRVFAKKFSSAINKARANVGYVNPEYFKPIYENVMGEEMPDGEFKMDDVVVRPSTRIKKYFFTREDIKEDVVEDSVEAIAEDLVTE